MFTNFEKKYFFVLFHIKKSPDSKSKPPNLTKLLMKNFVKPKRPLSQSRVKVTGATKIDDREKIVLLRTQYFLNSRSTKFAYEVVKNMA